MTLEGDALAALRAYAAGRRADLTATRLGAARLELEAAGYVRDCPRSSSLMYVEATPAGRLALADVERPTQLELFTIGAAA